MGIKYLEKSETTVPQEVEQLALLNLAEQVKYGKQLSKNSFIVIRFLAILFCLAFWYGVYILVNYIFLSG